MQAGAALASLAAVAACAGFGPPRAQTLARLGALPCAALVPGRFVVELESPGLAGIFDAVAAVGASSCRLQLFPDVGGKVLDLELRGGALVADLAGSSYSAAAPLDRAEPHLALLFAALLAELLAPVTAERVLGERVAGERIEVVLRPALGSGRVVATLAADGRVAACSITLGRMQVELAADGTFRGSGCSGRLGPAPTD